MLPAFRFIIIAMTIASTVARGLAAAENPPAKESAPAWVEDYPLDLNLPFDPETTSDRVHYHLIDQQTNQATEESHRRVVYQLLTPDAVEENSSLSFSYKAEDTRFTLNRLTIHRGGEPMDRLDQQEIRVLQRESSMEESSIRM